MTRFLLPSLGLGVFCFLISFNLASTRVAPYAPAQDEAVHEESEMDKEMLEVKAQVRLLRRSLRDPAKNEASLASLQILETCVLAAKGRIPRNTTDLPEAEQAAYVLAFRADMVTFLSTALSVEAAVLAGDHDAAQEHFKSFRAQEDPAHEKFTDED